MTDKQTLFACVAIAIVVVVFFLRNKIFNLRVSKGGVEIDNKPQEQRPANVVKGGKSLEGGANLTDNTGRGNEVENTTVKNDLNLTTNLPPKQ